MGLGILSTIKGFAPVVIYFAAIYFLCAALAGKRKQALWFFIVLLPLRNVVERLHVFPMGKDIDDVFIIVLLLSLVLKGLSKKDRIFSKSPYNLVIGLMIMYTFISLFVGSLYLNDYSLFSFSDSRVQSWKSFCILPFLFIFTYNFIEDKKSVWYTVLVMCLTIAFMDTYLTRQISWFFGIVSREKIRGTFVHLGINEIAAFYNQYTIILMGIYFFMKKSFKKTALLGLILINLYCVMFFFSRAAYVGLVAGLFFLFAIKKKILLIPLLFAAIFWQIVLPEQVQERITMTTNEYGELDRSSELRVVVWQDSLDLFMERPITGVGYGVFRHMGYQLGDTHNIYLKILAEQGIIGFFIFLLLVFIMFMQGIKLFTGGDDDLSKGLGLGFTIGIIVLMANNVFGDRWTYPELSAYLWVFAGLVARLNVISSQSKQELLAKKNNIKK